MSRGANLATPRLGPKDRWVIIINHTTPRVLETRAFDRRAERDQAAAAARAQYGDQAVTCDFIHNYTGRRVQRVWL